MAQAKAAVVLPACPSSHQSGPLRQSPPAAAPNGGRVCLPAERRARTPALHLALFHQNHFVHLAKNDPILRFCLQPIEIDTRCYCLPAIIQPIPDELVSTGFLETIA